MILLVSNSADVTADMVVMELRRRDLPFLRFDTDDYPRRVELEWTPQMAALQIDGVGSCTAADVTSVWWRRPVAPSFDESRPQPEREWAAGEAQIALDAFYRAIEGRWVNDRWANARADYKPYQLTVARQLGFDVPRTLVTNSRDRAVEFVAAQAETVCKPLLDGRVPLENGEAGLLFTSTLTTAMLDASFGPEPYLLQARVEKLCDVRVTVVGDQVFACEIDSQPVVGGQVDWRQADVAKLAHRPVELPVELEEACVALTRALDLRFSAIDLARRPDGRYSFFEINPNGQWAWVQQLTGLAICEALVDELEAAA
jgi:glutathione synthase/RimK-type ligase-like ATP-grasp enzyme